MSTPRKVTKAVIPAAGRGTRFLPATKAQPKEMLPIIDKPTIQYVVEEAVEAGLTDLLIIPYNTIYPEGSCRKYPRYNDSYKHTSKAYIDSHTYYSHSQVTHGESK